MFDFGIFSKEREKVQKKYVKYNKAIYFKCKDV